MNTNTWDSLEFDFPNSKLDSATSAKLISQETLQGGRTCQQGMFGATFQSTRQLSWTHAFKSGPPIEVASKRHPRQSLDHLNILVVDGRVILGLVVDHLVIKLGHGQKRQEDAHKDVSEKVAVADIEPAAHIIA